MKNVAGLRARLWLAILGTAAPACSPPYGAAPDAGAVAPVPPPPKRGSRVGQVECIPRAVAQAHGRPAITDMPPPPPPLVPPPPPRCPPSVTHDALPAAGYSISAAAAETDARVSAGEDVCCYGSTNAVPGRAYVHDGAAICAEVPRGPGADAPPEARAAQRWLEDSAGEHASIASFARATLELMAHGAPLDLITDLQRAALDEVRHTQLCLQIAGTLRARGAALDSSLAPPALGSLPALAPRRQSLAELAVACLVEACVPETIAAAVARESRRGAEDAQIRAALQAIADDEEEHAALAWRIVRWAVAVGGADVSRAVNDADLALAATFSVGLADGSLTAFGQPSDAARARVAAAVLERIVLPLRDQIIATSTSTVAAVDAERDATAAS